MFRKLLFMLLFACSAHSMAQVAITPIKPDVKNSVENTDYKLMGAPMPLLNLKVFSDTANKYNLTTSGGRDTASNNGGHHAHLPQSRTSSNDTIAAIPKRKKKIRKVENNPEEKPLAIKAPGYLTNADFDNGANLLVMMFNPTCSHCEDETELLEKNIFYFKKSKIILMANNMMWEYLPNFTKSFHTFEYPTITVGSDSNFISKVFLYSALPQINIYDKERKLIRTFSGETSIDSLKKYVE